MTLRKTKLFTISMVSILLGGAAVQAADVPVAQIAPLSGPWARGGQSMRQGTELAIEDINAAGGSKVLGGAKMKLHKRALQRLFEQNDVALDTAEIYALAAELK